MLLSTPSNPAHLAASSYFTALVFPSLNLYNFCPVLIRPSASFSAALLLHMIRWPLYFNPTSAAPVLCPQFTA